MTDYKPNPVRGVLCTLIGGCCWGFSGNCGQYLFNVHGVDPQWLTVVRMITAGLITVGIVAARDKQKLIDCAKNKHDRIMMLLYGVFGLLLSQYTYLEAINATNAGTATVLQYIGPVLVMVLVCFSGRRLPKAHEALSIVLVIVGTFLLATHGNPNTVVINPAGLFWGLFAACTLVLYTLLPKSIAPKYGAFMTTGLGTLIGGIAFFIIVHPWPLTVALERLAGSGGHDYCRHCHCLSSVCAGGQRCGPCEGQYAGKRGARQCGSHQCCVAEERVCHDGYCGVRVHHYHRIPAGEAREIGGITQNVGKNKKIVELRNGFS